MKPFLFEKQMVIIVSSSCYFFIAVIFPITGEISGGSVHLEEAAAVDLAVDVGPALAHDTTSDDIGNDE